MTTICDKDTVIDFTRGVMDRLRDFCEIPREGTTGNQGDGTWRYILPGGIERVFRIVPHGRLVLEDGKQLLTIASVRNESEAEEKIAFYLRGL